MLNTRQTWSGLLFLLSGLAAVVLGYRYGLGTLANMGPGLFPLVLGVVLILLGIVSVIEGAMSNAETIRAIDWWPLLCVTVSIAVFGLVVEIAGFAPAVLALALIAFAANPRPCFSWRSMGILLAMCILSVLLFVKLLGLPYPIFRI